MHSAALSRFLINEAELRQQAEREYLPTGIDAFDQALGGLPRGTLTEIWGAATSGKTTFWNTFLARATAAGEFCALVDGADTFDPVSAQAAGADLSKLLWVRCRSVEQALKATDLLLHAGGWGMVVMDLSEIRAAKVRRIPMTWWYRFRRAVERTPTAFLVVEQEPFVKNCAILALEFQPAPPVWSAGHPRFRVLRGIGVRVTPRKPVRAREAAFETRARGIA
jgi:recombination protein RecA